MNKRDAGCKAGGMNYSDVICPVPDSFNNLAYGINHRFRAIMLYVMAALFNHYQPARS
jgi:hypothetical protein